MPDINVYVTRPSEKEVPPLEGLENVLNRLEHVSEAKVEPSHSAVTVTFEGGRAEQQEIKRAIEEAGYEVSRVSVRSDFPRG